MIKNIFLKDKLFLNTLSSKGSKFQTSACCVKQGCPCGGTIALQGYLNRFIWKERVGWGDAVAGNDLPIYRNFSVDCIALTDNG